MPTFTLAVSCLTTSNLPWFMDLTFQVPMQYCSLQHQTFLLSPVTSTAGYIFSLAPFLHPFWSYFPLISSSILGTYQPREFPFQYPVCLFKLFMGFSRQEYWSGLPFPSPVDHILSVDRILISNAYFHLFYHDFQASRSCAVLESFQSQLMKNIEILSIEN